MPIEDTVQRRFDLMLQRAEGLFGKEEDQKEAPQTSGGYSEKKTQKRTKKGT